MYRRDVIRVIWSQFYSALAPAALRASTAHAAGFLHAHQSEEHVTGPIRRACHWTNQKGMSLDQSEEHVTGPIRRAYHWTNQKSMSLDQSEEHITGGCPAPGDPVVGGHQGGGRQGWGRGGWARGGGGGPGNPQLEGGVRHLDLAGGVAA